MQVHNGEHQEGGTGKEAMRIAQVDAFTTQPFGGNGATVVLLSGPVAGQSLQALAAECAQSETAFLLHMHGQWLLRWLTPTVEVSLCGHGTMAAARALSHWGVLAAGQRMDLHSRSGPLPVEQRGAGFRIQLPTGQLHQVPLDSGLDQLLGTPVQQRWTSSLRYGLGRVIEVALVDATFPLAELALDQDQLRQRPCLGLVVMQANHPGTAGIDPPDYVLRFFAPQAGIPEDPVTGSAHALVAPYWLARTGSNMLKAQQLSPRGGHLRLFPRGADHVALEGETALVWSGDLLTTLEPGGQQDWEDLLP